MSLVVNIQPIQGCGTHLIRFPRVAPGAIHIEALQASAYNLKVEKR